MEAREQQTERVTKLDAARRQLSTAILLFFEERDDVAILTLGFAAHGIFAGLDPPRGSALNDMAAIEGLADEVQRFQDFFRSAHLDPGEALHLTPTLIVCILTDCVLMHRALTRKLAPEHGAFLTWVAGQPDAPFPVRGQFREAAEKLWAAGRVPTKQTFLGMLRRGTFRVKPRPAG